MRNLFGGLWIDGLWKKLESFWFDFSALKGLSLMRLVVGFVMLALAISRHRGVELFYSNQGMLPRDLFLEIVPELYRPEISFFIWPESWVSWVHLSYIGILALLFLGVGGRLAAFAAWFLHVGFFQRNFSVVFGADLIGGIWLFYLAMGKNNAYFSVLNLLNKSRKVSLDIFSSAAARLIQIHLALIYAYTGWEKLKGASWWEGSSLWTVLANPQLATLDFTWTAGFPLMIAALVYLTLIFEIYFIALVWLPKFRNWFLVSGVLFHLGIAATVGLWEFSLIMIASYAVFMKDSEWNLRG